MRLEQSLAAALTNPLAGLRALDRADSEESLAGFVKCAWNVLEPGNPYVHGWHIDAMCEHLEAVTAGQINRLYIAVPPGCMKSLTVSTFWPAWEWGPHNTPSMRIVATSHQDRLAVRDNLRTRRLIQSPWYQSIWGDRVILTGDQNAKTKFENTATGFREAMPFTSLTGSRGDRVIIDDPMSVDDAASEAKRGAITQTFLEAVPTRLNNPKTSAIVIIMQRLHERDVVGVIEAKELGYESLVLPMEFEPELRCTTTLGFRDPRQADGELLFPDRFPRDVVERDKKVMGSFAVAGQFQQRPAPREGGLFKRAWFEVVSSAPNAVRWVRGWDLAASEKSAKSNPAFTAGVKVGLGDNGIWYIADVQRGQLSPEKVERLIANTASQDGTDCVIDLPQDPGQAGKAQIRYLVSRLSGFTVKFGPETGSKVKRAEPVAAQAEAGNVKLVAGKWTEAFLSEIEVFPNGAYMDQVDALSRAFSRLLSHRTVNFTPVGPIMVRG